MSVAELQLQLHQAIDSIQDQEKLAAIYSLIRGESGPFNPMKHDEYVKAIDEAREQLQKGQFTTMEDLEKESENW